MAIIQGVMQLSTLWQLSNPNIYKFVGYPKIGQISLYPLLKFMQIPFFKALFTPQGQNHHAAWLSPAPCTPRVCWLALPAVPASLHSTAASRNVRGGQLRRRCRRPCNVTWRSGEVLGASCGFWICKIDVLSYFNNRCI